MSALIAYVLIGVTMATGLVCDRWDKVREPRYGLVDVVAITAAWVTVVAAWPMFITPRNMESRS